MLAPAPSVARPKGIAQHEDATTAPRPAASPSAANHFGAAVVAGDVSAGMVSCAWSVIAMARSSLMIGLFCTP